MICLLVEGGCPIWQASVSGEHSERRFLGRDLYPAPEPGAETGDCRRELGESAGEFLSPWQSFFT